MEVAIRIGLRIPADLALVGVDNDRNVCESAPVTISSVARDSWKEGYEAAALLDALMSGRKPPRDEVLIPPVEVVCRESTNLLSAVEPRLAAAVEFVREHIGDPFGVKALEKAAGVSRRWLHTHFKEHFGCTAHEFILRQRIEQAKSMLDQPHHVHFADVAQACGFSDVRHLRAAMRRVEGVTPAEYCRRKRPDGR
jgi:LacI family transcriptional regulator